MIYCVTGNDSRDTEYPKLRREFNTNLIVLFSSAGTGVVVGPGTTAYNIGDYKENWSPDAFKDYNGKITLYNT